MLAAAGHPVVDFSLRRTHGPQAGFQAARTAGLVGFAGTSNVAAATRLGLPASGTMATRTSRRSPTRRRRSAPSPAPTRAR